VSLSASEKVHKAIVAAIDSTRMNATAIGEIYGPELKTVPRTLEQRVRRLLSRLPVPMRQTVDFLDAIGWEIVVKRKSPKN
jgi:hypothetical protein